MWESHLITIHIVMVRALVVVTIIHIHVGMVVRSLRHLPHKVLIHIWAETLRHAISLEALFIKIIFWLGCLLFQRFYA